MDCKASRQLMEVCRPDSADAAELELAGLAEHLEECPACEAVFRATSQADRRIGQAMRDVPVPARLKERLLMSLGRAAAEECAVDRSPLRVLLPWRRRLSRRRLIWIGAGMTGIAADAAIVALVAPWRGNGYVTRHVLQWEVLDHFAALEACNWQMLEPQDPRDRQSINQRVREQLGLEGAPPEAVPIEWIAAFADGTFQEERVVVFRYRMTTPSNVYVFALPSDLFQVTDVREEGADALATQGLVAAVWRESGFIYVLVYEGSDDSIHRVFDAPEPTPIADRGLPIRCWG